jgi:hypothetical protein
MPWNTDLTSALAMPAGVVMLAGLFYTGSVYAEKIASKQALSDIANMIKNTSWEYSLAPNKIIIQIFSLTFGDRHLSWKCISRSILVTIIITIIFSIGIYKMVGRYPSDIAINNFHEVTRGHKDDVERYNLLLALDVFFIEGILADYTALWKTRILLRVFAPYALPIFMSLSDILLSLSISIGYFYIWYVQYFLWLSPFPSNPPILISAYEGSSGVQCFVNFYCLPCKLSYARCAYMYANTMLVHHLTWVINPTSQEYSEYLPVLFSTLFTSIWTIVVLVSASLLKLLSPVHKVTAWFFDLENHPVQAIGTVSSALILMGWGVWTGIRTVI